MHATLRPLWSRWLTFDWKLALGLILLVCIPRFLLVLEANASGNYGWIGLIMVLSGIIPLLLLSRVGRKKIGLRRFNNFRSAAVAFCSGLIAGYGLYVLGELLYAGSYENWYVYIGKSYAIPQDIPPGEKHTLFAVMALAGMTFSPIGEEFFFRGIVHESLLASVGEKDASIADGSAFALTHISHFGLVYVYGRWLFLFVPALMWVLSMFLVSLLFYRMKVYSGSLWAAVLCHAGFNLGMIYAIFYLL